MDIKPKDFNRVNFKFFRTIIYIFYRIFMVVSAILAVTLVVIAVLPKRLFELSGESLKNLDFEMGNIVRLNLELTNIDTLNIKWTVLAMIFVALLLLIVTLLITKNLALIFDTLVDKNPFAEQNAKRIAHIGILLIALSTISNLPEFISYLMIIKVTNIDYIDIVYSIDQGLLFSGILVIILSTIFKYGTFLQNEYNETL